jgi:hypothetical protein
MSATGTKPPPRIDVGNRRSPPFVAWVFITRHVGSRLEIFTSRYHAPILRNDGLRSWLAHGLGIEEWENDSNQRSRKAALE